MGKASSSKKVARAAGIGGGRTNRGKAPVLWYSTLVVILLAGVGLTAFSRDQRLEELGSPSSKEEPRPGTHWHVALGVRVCDQWLDPLSTETDNNGIHTHGDGLIHVEPNLASVSGRRATFERFVEPVKGEVAADRFAWPEGDGKKKVEHKTGDKCGEQEGEVKAFYNGEPHDGDPSEIRLTDQGKLVLAFVPKGTTYDQIGDPPSTAELAKQGAPEQQQSQSSAADPAAAAHEEGDSHAPGAHDEAPADPTGSTAPTDGSTATTVAPAPTTPPSSEAPPSSSAPPTGG